MSSVASSSIPPVVAHQGPADAATFDTVALVGRNPSTAIAASIAEVAGFVESTGRRAIVETETARHLALPTMQVMSTLEIGSHADVVIVLGGDGTMLGVARQLAAFGVPMIGINQGRLGFMTDIPAERKIAVLTDMLNGKIISEHRSLLEGVVLRNGESICNALAVNDVVVARGAGSGMIELRVEVDGHFMYNQRSDGLIVGTPTGSTAYALSAGGPLLHPSLGGIVLVPIAPHALSNRPIVVPDSSEIVVEVISGRDCSVNFDMQSFAGLQHHDRLVIKRSAHAITFLHPEGWSYYDTLREKLHWNEYPSVEGRLK
ncbi:MAG: NAD kinase [Pseudomonadota bacterium]